MGSQAVMTTSSNDTGDSYFDSSDTENSRQIYSSEALAKLEQVYLKNKYPSRQDRETLALELGISSKKLQIWFQNRRARARKQEQKASGYFDDPLRKLRLQMKSPLRQLHCPPSSESRVSFDSLDTKSCNYSSAAVSCVSDNQENFTDYHFNLASEENSFHHQMTSIDLATDCSFPLASISNNCSFINNTAISSNCSQSYNSDIYSEQSVLSSSSENLQQSSHQSFDLYSDVTDLLFSNLWHQDS